MRRSRTVEEADLQLAIDGYERTAYRRMELRCEGMTERDMLISVLVALDKVAANAGASIESALCWRL